MLQRLSKRCSNWGGTVATTCEIDHRVGGNNVDRIRKLAAEFAALAPDVILTAGATSVGPLLQATRSVPVVFVNVADPVGAGYAESLARPGGNATGFVSFEYNLSGKWVELLKQIAPGVTRAGVLRDAAISSGIGQFAVIQSVAPSIGVDVSPISVRDSGEIERGIAAFARFANGGLIATASAATVFHRDLIIKLAAQHKLPAVYSRRLYVTSGGLISYGSDILDQFRRAAGYVDQYPEGGEARRNAGSSADQIRNGDQSQNGQSTRYNHAACLCSPALMR